MFHYKLFPIKAIKKTNIAIVIKPKTNKPKILNIKNIVTTGCRIK